MAYIETIKDDEFHRYIAKMTGAAVKGDKLKDNAFEFSDLKACERVAGIINKIYGGGIRDVVNVQADGLEQVPNQRIKEVEKKQSSLNISENIINSLLNKNDEDNSVKLGKYKAELIKKIAINEEALFKKKEELDTNDEPIEFKELENIGVEEFTIDDNIDNEELSLSPAKRVERIL